MGMLKEFVIFGSSKTALSLSLDGVTAVVHDSPYLKMRGREHRAMIEHRQLLELLRVPPASYIQRYRSAGLDSVPWL